MLLVHDVEHQLARLDRLGQVIVRKPAPGPLVMAALADDGNTVAAIGKRNQVWLMTAELSVTWERTLARRPLAVALDAFGRQLGVADEAGGVHVFDTAGK